MIETAVAALIGAGASAVGSDAKTPVKCVRMFLAGFFLAFFGGQDLCNIIQHFFSFTISKGGIVFFTAYVGSAFLERFIITIKSFRIEARK